MFKNKFSHNINSLLIKNISTNVYFTNKATKYDNITNDMNKGSLYFRTITRTLSGGIDV